MEFGFQNFLKACCNNLSNYIQNSIEKMTLCQTIFLNTDYGIAYELYKDFNNLKKALGIDKKAILKSDSIFTISISDKAYFEFEMDREEVVDGKK